MNPETIDIATRWLSLFTLIGAIAGSVIIIGTAVLQSLKARTVRWDVLAFILVLLWSLPYGIRNYGPELMDASIDLINNMSMKREPLEAALKNLIGDTGTTSQVLPVEHPTPIGGFPTAVPQPQPTPTVNQFEATATVYFATVEPTATAQPMIQPTATTCIAWQSSDLMRGCVPPTPSR